MAGRKSKKTKKNQSITHKLNGFTGTHKKLILLLCVVIPVSLFGTYYLIHAPALGSPGSVMYDVAQESVVHNAGSSFDLPIYSNNGNDLPFRRSMRITVASGSNFIKQTAAASCNPALRCRPALTMQTYIPNTVVDYSACFNFGPGLAGNNDAKLLLFTLHYTAVTTGAIVDARDNFATTYAWTYTACGEPASNASCYNGNTFPAFMGPDADTDDSYLDQMCRLGRTDPGDGSTQPNGPPNSGSSGQTSSPNAGNSSQATSTANSKKHNSQSSGGSSATTQTNAKNTTPSSTGQGNSSTQATIKPSPFYDGRQFSSGSNAQVFIGDLTVAHHTVRYGYILILCLIIASAAAGLAVWRYRRAQH